MGNIESKLELLDKKFLHQLNLAKENLNKARQSEAFKDFDAFLIPNEQYIENIEYNRDNYLKFLFNVDVEDYKESIKNLIEFLQFHTEQLTYLNSFFEEAKTRKDI